MAIFSYDNINAKKNDYNDDVIDSMYEMCQDMLDVLDEHGGNIKNLAKAQAGSERAFNYHKNQTESNRAKQRSFEDLAAAKHDQGEKRQSEALLNAAKKAKEKADYHSEKWDNYDTKKSIYRGMDNDEYRPYINRMMARRNDSKAPNYVAGKYKNIENYKKATIKETCYMILDMLDDMD